MSSVKKKLLKEFLAIVLALAMIFTGLQTPFVYADGLQAEQQEVLDSGGGNFV